MLILLPFSLYELTRSIKGPSRPAGSCCRSLFDNFPALVNAAPLNLRNVQQDFGVAGDFRDNVGDGEEGHLESCEGVQDDLDRVRGDWTCRRGGRGGSSRLLEVTVSAVLHWCKNGGQGLQ